MGQPSDTNEEKLTSSRQRIAAAFAAKNFDAAGHAMVGQLAQHLQHTQSGQSNVLNWEQPQALIAAAKNEMQQLAVGFSEDRVSKLATLSLAHGINLHHPRYVGHQVPAAVPMAALFDLIGSVTNQAMAVFEMGPWATAVERAVIDAVGEQIGFPAGKVAGLVTSGGSLANLTALLTARNVMLGDVWTTGLNSQSLVPALVVHADAHYSISRAAGIMGLGTRQIVPAAIDENRRMDAHQLNKTLRDLRTRKVPIVAVCSCACATPIGAFDPLNDIADVCQEHGVWLHVDAAHGGAACFSDQHRHLVAGLARADSVICDAHKMMFMPSLCAMVFYRESKHRYSAFHQEAPYLFDPSAEHLAEYESGLVNLECTKRAAAMGLWGVWSMFGQQLFSDLVEVTFDLARQFYEMLKVTEDFVVPYSPECNIVVFRYLPRALDNATQEQISAFQRRLRRRVIESGDAYLVASTIDGKVFLRTTLINPLTTVDDLQDVLDMVRNHATACMRGAS